MAGITSTAQVLLTINGKQAQDMMNDLQKRATDLKTRIVAAASAGDKATMNKLKRELNQVNRAMNDIRNQTVTTEQILKKLDKATPKELQKALKTLKFQLNGIERGSDAWNAQIEKIKAVKAELERLNQEMQADQSFWEKLNGKLRDFGLGFAGIAATIAGAVKAGKAAVERYAELQQEMAGVQKYTGMTWEEVQRLNEGFKEMDTRTSRENLNLLAQDAGRLGKTSVEDILGFVRAADQINVALDDLGDSATLTLSKLTTVFGDEEKYGTEQALLKVGSVINELSQNCAASASYIADFTERLGGVGAQANLTVPQIMSFAAVLDANSQSVETSATALQQTLTKLMADPAKYAQAVGLNVKEFTNLLKTDANEALLTFIESLNKVGSMDKLAPLLADMGEKGKGSVATLATLANNIDFLRQQQEAANTAFEEGSSITNECAVQNSTLQAQLEKSKNQFNELVMVLGEKLAPIMTTVYNTGSMLAKAMGILIDYVLEHKTEIILLTASIVSYNVAANLAAIKTAFFTAKLAIQNTVLTASKNLVLLLRMAFYQLTAQTQKAEAAQRLFNRTSKANPWGLIATAIGIAITALVSFIKSMSDANKSMADTKSQTQKILNEIQREAEASTKAEIALLDELYKKTQDQTLATDERIAAINRIREIYPDYFDDISDEAFMAGKAADAYNNLKNAILAAAIARGKSAKIEDLEKEIVDLEAKWEKEAEYWITRKWTIMGKNPTGYLNDPEYRLAQHNLDILDRQYKEPIRQKRKMQEGLAKDVADIEVNKPKSVAERPEPPHRNNHSSKNKNSQSSVTKDKFEAEKDWREQEEAKNNIAYAKGEKSYIQYLERMNEIEVEFYKKQLEHKDLETTERLKIEADYYTALKKQQDQFHSESIEEAEYLHNDRVAELKQAYLDESISRETFDKKMKEEEIYHQRVMVELYKEGTKERMDAESKLSDLLEQELNKRYETKKELEEKYASMKSEYFGDNPQEAQAKYDADLAMLKVVYDREIKAAGDNAAEKLRIEEAFEKAKLLLKKKYGILSAEDEKNAMEKGMDSFIEWMESDGGKAVLKSFDTIVSGMSSIFTQLNSIVQADLEMRTAQIEKTYDKEIERAEGNSFRIAQLEKRKEKEIAEEKKKANRKMFAMQVIQAIAQTAQNALNAYGSAAAIPIVGYIMAPIAAAMAVAAGAIQIAAIKKQQQASEAQGYAEGGFTPKGGKYEEVGTVHAGEWVASQKLVNNPKVRPLLEALDYAQRTNTIGSITNQDVSKSITAPILLAQAAGNSAKQTSDVQSPTVIIKDDKEYADTMKRLAQRLDEPFVTVNTVTGDFGIKRAQSDYEKLIRNKTPKSRR